MRHQPPAESKQSEKRSLMEEKWAEAAKAFETICGESLQKGEVKGFDDVQRKIESASKASYGLEPEQVNKWEKAKSVGLTSLKYLKLLVGAASQASDFIPIPGAAANIAGSALCFVFDIPQTIRGYNEAIDQVFSEVSSALSQFQIYKSMDDVDPILIEKIHAVMVSFVKICAHVVKYRQSRKRDRAFRQLKSIFDDDSGLSGEMTEFKRVLQQQRDVEGTITLAVVVETQHDVAVLLEQFISFEKITEETHQVVQDTQKGVQALKNDADRMKTLINIRDTLGVPATVRLDVNTTQTCTNIHDACLDGTGSWIWIHDAYTTWTTSPSKDKESSHVLILSGPPSSGKSSAVAMITKRLEEQKGRTYVAHYFFPASNKKSDEDKHPVQSALKYMAFQIARVDATIRKALGKACEAGPSSFRRSASLETLDALWEELKIGASGTGATYYLVFDGLDNLSEKQARMLLTFVFGSKVAGESPGRVRVLVSGTDDLFAGQAIVGDDSALRIQMEKHNVDDMRIMIQEELAKRGMLQHARPDSDQQRARDKIIKKLPENVSGSYSMLKFGLNDVVRLLSTRTAIQELDKMLDQSMSSHEAAIKNLQRSLTADEVNELNELLKWVLFSNESMTLDQLEAAMLLYSGTESLASLDYIIRNKYSAVLKLEDGFVYSQDGVQDYLQKEKDALDRLRHSEDRATISMSITINNMDQELCGHFLWDLAQKAIREKFHFDFNAASAGHGSNQGVIAVDQFEAHRTIVSRAFEYLNMEHSDQTGEIGRYIACWLPYHLSQLRQLEDEDKGALSAREQLEIGQNLYMLFKDGQVFRRHRASFSMTWWTGDEIEDVHKWLTDSAVVRRLDKKWRAEVNAAVPRTRGFLKEFVKVVVEGFLRERSWNVKNAYDWIEGFMDADDKKLGTAPEPSSNSPTPSSPESATPIDWDSVSTWCQNFLGLPDSQLDSLWYERMAAAAFSQASELSTVLALYQRAIEKESPSWLCYQGLATTYSSQGRTLEAIEQMEKALKEAELEGATPKPEADDIATLHLLLGEYSYEAGDMQTSAKHFLVLCDSGNSEQAKQGQFGHLKAALRFPNAEEMQQLLENLLIAENSEMKMVSLLKMIARDREHDALISKMFIVAKRSPHILRGLVQAMELATASPPSKKDRGAELSEEDSFAENEIRGVLLYDRGFAEYTYNVSPDGTDAVGKALRLWKESCKLLSKVGGRNASVVRQRATTALAQHYFQSMVDGKHLDHVDALTKLAESDPNMNRSDSTSLLATLYALRGEKIRSRHVLERRIRIGLQILSDDISENDAFGLSFLQKALEEYHDFKNAAVAVSLLGQPDLVTEALRFVAEDVSGGDSEYKDRVLNLVNKLAKETIQVVKDHIPDASEQQNRIEAAIAHVTSLVANPAAPTEPVARGEDGDVAQAKAAESELSIPDLETAQLLLINRLRALHSQHTPEIIATGFQRVCDGLTADGEPCENEVDWVAEFYHCVYCSDCDFCKDCLARLRHPDASGPDIMVCSANHQWVRMPPQGADMYVGMNATNVPVPKEVRPVAGDKSILEFYYGEDGGGGREETTMEAWKESLAAEWEMSLDEIKDEISKQTTLEESEQDE